MATKTATKPQRSAAKLERYTTSLRVKLEPEEIAERADRAAQMLADRDSKEEEQKAAAKHAKSVIEALDADIRRLSNEVRTRSTYRPTDCERRFDYAKKMVTEIRTDTGEVVAERRMTAAELQMELPFADDDANDDAAKTEDEA